MSVRPLDPDAVGLPRFADEPARAGEVTLFDLSSHERAREALALGLAVKDIGFNIFVLGEDRSGRMTATLDFLKDHVEGRPAPADWVYLNNFQRPHKPRPYRLPHGQGRRFKDRLKHLVPALGEALRKAFESPDFGNDVERLTGAVGKRLEEAFAAVREAGQAHNLRLDRTPQGINFTPLDDKGEAIDPETLSDEDKARISAALETLREPIRLFNVEAAREGAALAERMGDLRRQTADRAVAPLLDDLEREFGELAALRRWLIALRADVVEHIELFLPQENPPPPGHRAEDRYAANLIVDNADARHPNVVLEPNPTYENLFGYIEYQSINGILDTDFRMIRPGALHRANGGILVLRADALAREFQAWEALKGALRDREVRIEERPRAGALPMVGAPSPKPIPLDLKVVIVGSPRWYYAFFTADPDFQVYFKVKADIDADLEASEPNLETYRALILHSAERLARRTCEDGAVAFLLGQGARWAGARDKLTARFELVEDVVAEAGLIADRESAECLTGAHVRRAVDDRRRRNARLEDRAQELIARGSLLIDTAGSVVGQVNGLTVQSTGDHSFGAPARVSARTFVGPQGVLNIERVVEMGGPIQQKGVYILEGYLKGRFAQTFPLSFSASLTFEQNYAGVEGDSASLAELVAILSSLAQAPVRQDVAITGSVNQMGRAQAIGGLNEKVEGFFRTCQARGLSGGQGVILPRANEIHLTLRDEVAAAVAAKKFHLWSVETVEDAAALLTGLEAGEPDADGAYPPDTLYGRAMATLAAYDRALMRRYGGPPGGGGETA